jgi:O-acetyl-ADP-ribose deacetylase (regulator of RNase III)
MGSALCHRPGDGKPSRNVFLFHAINPGSRVMNVTVVDGDLLDQDVDAIVNAWNRNVIPWRLLLPQGVSGAIKRRGGIEPFRELSRIGPMPLGSAVRTSAGKLPFRGIIHVAGINLLWRSSERSVRDSVRSAIALAVTLKYRSIAMPLIGAGSGGGDSHQIERLILDELSRCEFDGDVIVVRYAKRATKAVVIEGAAE